MSILFVLLVNNSIVKTIDFNFHFINVDFHLTSPNLIYKIHSQDLIEFHIIVDLLLFVSCIHIYVNLYSNTK